MSVRRQTRERALADFVVLGQDPDSIEPHRIKDVPIEMTVIGGRIVYQRNSDR